MAKFLGALCLASTSLACITLESVNGAKLGVRGGGNINDSPLEGCNRISCGKFRTTDRILVKASDVMSLQSKLHDVWEGGHIKYEIKYGNNPDFDMTPGFEIEENEPHHVAANAKDGEMWVKNFELDALYNSNATIMVSYITDGMEVSGNNPSVGKTWDHFDNPKSIFHQCIDIAVTSGAAPFPDGVWENGIGKLERDDILNNGAGVVPAPSTYAWYWPWILFAFFLIAAVILGGGAYHLCNENKGLKPVPMTEPIVKKPTEPMPPAPVPPKEKTPTRSASDEDEVVGVVHYEDAEVPQTPSKNMDNTGSLGRHFHFRYVNENEGDDADDNA